MDEAWTYVRWNKTQKDKYCVISLISRTEVLRIEKIRDRKKGKLLLNGSRVSVLGWWKNSGDGQWWRPLMPLNRTFKSGKSGKFMLCICYHSKKKKKKNIKKQIFIKSHINAKHICMYHWGYKKQKASKSRRTVLSTLGRLALNVKYFLLISILFVIISTSGWMRIDELGSSWLHLCT